MLTRITRIIEKAAAVVTDSDESPVHEEREQMDDPTAGDGHEAAYLLEGQAARGNRGSRGDRSAGTGTGCRQAGLGKLTGGTA